MRRKPQSHIPRRVRRHPVERMFCGLGQVVDLSRAGMRIACDTKPPVEIGQRGAIKLTADTGALPLTGRVVWLRRAGAWPSKKHEIGIEFVAVAEPMRHALDILARFGYIDPIVATGGSRRWRKSEHQTRQALRVDFDLPNYYHTLSVEPDADLPAIKKAYRRLARRYHPDVAPDGGDAERFNQITEAFAVLSDPLRRKTFDRMARRQAPAGVESA